MRYMIRVTTVKEAWELAGKLFPSDYKLDSSSSERAGYEIYRSTAKSSNACICDLNTHLELNYDNGLSENIWIEEQMVEDNIVIVGMYRERPIFGDVKVKDVVEIPYHRVIGFVNKTLDDGRPGIEITMHGGETTSFGHDTLAYIKLG